MSDKLASLMKTLDRDTSLGLGIVVMIMGFLLRFVSPIEVFGEFWVFSMMGTIVLALGLLLIIAGVIHFLMDKESVNPLNRFISRKDLARKYPGISFDGSNTVVKTIEVMARTKKPMNRKEITRESGLSSNSVAQALKSFAKKGLVTELQIRNTSYYVLADRGLKLHEDIDAPHQKEDGTATEDVQKRLRGSWLKRKLHEHQTARGDKMPMTIKEKVIRGQAVLAFGFVGGLFVHFGLTFDIFALSPQGELFPFLMTLVVLSWIASTVVCARKVVGNFGLVTLTLAWMSGFILVNGDPFTTLGVTLLISSVGIGAFAELYS
jgi:DNA-binding transcriptional regulator GbsR (MarR family)